MPFVTFVKRLSCIIQRFIVNVLSRVVFLNYILLFITCNTPEIV